MARLKFGWDPLELTVVLSWGGGWTQAFQRLDKPFDDGDRVLMRFYVTDDDASTPVAEWEATLSAATGLWDQTPDDVLTVLHAEARVVRVHLIPASAPTKPVVWATGDYIRK